MNEKTLRALIDAGAVKKINIIANGAQFHVDALTPNGAVTAMTLKGKVKTWRSLDSAAKWIRTLGFGEVRLIISKWEPSQQSMQL